MLMQKRIKRKCFIFFPLLFLCLCFHEANSQMVSKNNLRPPIDEVLECDYPDKTMEQAQLKPW